jgi:broad specificity phosphatase PhoE
MFDFDQLDWTQSARKLLEHIPLLQSKFPLYLLLRHSHREDKNLSWSTPITEIGREAAFEYGRRLGFEFSREIKLYNIPLVRCFQTAEAIRLGLQNAGRNVINCGIWEELQRVGGNERVRYLIEQKYGHGYVNRWLEGTFSSFDIESALSYSQRILKKMFSIPKNIHPPLVIMISHDDSLLAFRGILTGIMVDERWLSFLGGYWIQFLPEGILFGDDSHTPSIISYPSWWDQINEK